MSRAHRPVLLLLLLLLGMSAVTAARSATTAAPTPAPAEWRSYDVLVRLQGLPRTYSCDELWYKFRDLLRTLGARAYMTITPYHCGVVGGGPAASPSVQLQFQLPWALSAAAVRYAQTSVIDETVQLAPGSPPTLQAGDCELLKQLRSTLFATLPLKITAADFSCVAGGESFAVTLKAPIAAAVRGADSAPAALHSPAQLPPTP
jgi:hypothetical protein